MKKETMGSIITSRRKEKGMTQLEVAQHMGVTDKAVSKWERDLSCPDINSLPKLAELFEMSVDELMQVKAEAPKDSRTQAIENALHLVLRAVPLAMGVGVAVLSVLKEIDLYSGFTMLGIGLACIGIVLMNKE